jgi:hypothetical protein
MPERMKLKEIVERARSIASGHAGMIDRRGVERLRRRVLLWLLSVVLLDGGR